MSKKQSKKKVVPVVAEPGDETAVENGAPAPADGAPEEERAASQAPPDAQDLERTAAEGEFADDDDIERVYTKPELDELLAAERDRQLRILAEYDNFRRRTAREKEQWRAEGLEDFVKDLLPVLDSFDKAREAETDGAAREGVEVMFKQLQSTLANHEIDVIDPAGEPFDPRFHEAMTRAPAGDHAPGTVLQVFDKGYSIRGRLVRAARVAVAAEQ
jgi:molecular chaperone GrpE